VLENGKNYVVSRRYQIQHDNSGNQNNKFIPKQIVWERQEKKKTRKVTGNLYDPATIRRWKQANEFNLANHYHPFPEMKMNEFKGASQLQKFGFGQNLIDNLDDLGDQMFVDGGNDQDGGFLGPSLFNQYPMGQSPFPNLASET
jgi:hypothetical protein